MIIERLPITFNSFLHETQPFRDGDAFQIITRALNFDSIVYDPDHPFSLILQTNEKETWFCQLYESFREVSYPYNYKRSQTSIYGYPDLSRSWIC